METDEFTRAVQENPINRAILERLPETRLKDVWLVSGSLFQTVWNLKTGRAPGYGIKDYDLVYFDDADLSWEAENATIGQAMEVLADIDAEIEIRNQARVHLWYEQKFGVPYARLRQATDCIDRFLATTCMFGITCSDSGQLDVYAPKGFADLEGLIIRPNPLENFDTVTYRSKARRWRQCWPELQFEDVD